MLLVAEASCNGTEDCSNNIYLGFSGDDKYGQVFNSGYQITRINEFAIESFYDAAKAQVRDRLDACASNQHAFSSEFA